MGKMTQLSQLGLFDARVPRYTSYPTAPQFTNAVGPNLNRQWIESIPPGSNVSLYVHVPFCRHLCWFCACRTQGTQRIDTVRAYLDTLLDEIRQLGAILPQGVTLSRLHWGGGTPTLMTPDMITTLAEAIDDVVPRAEGGEFSIEIDPNEIDQPRLDALVNAGMSRASIGVQDFDPAIQDMIGRQQSYEKTRDVVDMIRAAGITSLNADILFGLPDQTTTRIADSVQKLLTLSPDRVALYGYAHVPWMARRQAMIPSDKLPSPQARLDLFETARELFEWDGYEQIGIDHFARPEDSMAVAAKNGSLRRNFQGYTVDPSGVLIGVGASSISRFPQGYAQNEPSTGKYTAQIRAGELPTVRGHAFSVEDKVRARLIELLMCHFQARIEDVILPDGPDAATIRGWMKAAEQQFKGFLHFDEDCLTIPAEGRPLTRIIARAFDAYDLSKAGHSTAV